MAGLKLFPAAGTASKANSVSFTAMVSAFAGEEEAWVSGFGMLGSGRLNEGHRGAGHWLVRPAGPSKGHAPMKELKAFPASGSRGVGVVWSWIGPMFRLSWKAIKIGAELWFWYAFIWVEVFILNRIYVGLFS
jgi:hypothetical protein